ncbi:MAG TPA: tetratricopeptide repeat protein, partial [Pseudomonadales bacterium]|nr:tetratricopeptide repeat protein [Pseudomonadales bacterium]
MTTNKKLENLSRNLQRKAAAVLPPGAEPQSRWERFHAKAKLFGDVIVACKNILVNIMIALVALVTIVVIVKTVASRSVTVKPIPVPSKLSSHGYTEKVLATRIAAKLAEINQVATSERRRVPKLPVVLIEDRPDIKIPGEALSFQAIVSYLKEVVGLQDVEVSVDVTEDEKNLAAQIRIIGGPGSGNQAFAESPITIDVEEFVQNIASETMRLFSPEILASYKLSVAVSKCHGSRVCDTEEALKLFNEILSRSAKPDASYVWALKGKANTLQEMGRDEEALDYVQRILALNKNDADAYLVWANALSHLGQVEPAIAKYQETLKIDPFSVAANINLGILYKKQCRLDDAIAQYKNALKYNPRSVGGHYNLGLALYAKAR